MQLMMTLIEVNLSYRTNSVKKKNYQEKVTLLYTMCVCEREISIFKSHKITQKISNKILESPI